MLFAQLLRLCTCSSVHYNQSLQEKTKISWEFLMHQEQKIRIISKASVHFGNQAKQCEPPNSRREFQNNLYFIHNCGIVTALFVFRKELDNLFEIVLSGFVDEIDVCSSSQYHLPLETWQMSWWYTAFVICLPGKTRDSLPRDVFYHSMSFSWITWMCLGTEIVSKWAKCLLLLENCFKASNPGQKNNNNNCYFLNKFKGRVQWVNCTIPGGRWGL